MSHSRLLSSLLLSLALALLARGDELRDAQRDYRSSIARPALYVRVKAIVRLARTRDPKALQTLIKRYQRPEPPEDHVAYLVAGISAEAFSGPEHEEAWTKWLSKEKSRSDAWLWFLGQGLRGAHSGAGPLVEAALDSDLDPFLRAASLQALARANHPPETLEAIQKLLAERGPALKKKRDLLGRSVLVEACALALARTPTGSEGFAPAAELVIDMLERDDLLPRTPWVIARRLADALGVGELYLEAGPWRKALQAFLAKKEEAGAAPGKTRVRPVQLPPGRSIPRFLGIEGSGSRVAFVIDCSDSMLTPLTPSEVEEMKRPVTGSDRTAPRPVDDPSEDLAKQLPWERIKTRFDAAREALKLSLASLGEKMEYVVITFGQDASLLGDQGLVSATPPNVQRTIRALDAIRAKPGGADRPHGTLMGYTNLHGGLRDAFQVTSRGLLERDEHVAEGGFREGVETIFLLSDGAPSWDDFDAVDKNDQDLNSGDPEAGTQGAKSPTLNFYGPYVFVDHLVRDVIRMNLFRQAEIHCIGIGEANEQLLKLLAEVGGGEFRRIAGGGR